MVIVRPVLIAVAGAALLLAGCDNPKPRPAASAAPPPAPLEGPPPAMSEGLPKRPEFPGFYLDHAGSIADPLNNPTGKTVATEPLLLDGFGYDSVAKLPAKGVDVVIDGKAYGTAYGSEREDVAAFNKVPALSATGYRLVLPAGAVPPGKHIAHVRVVAADGLGYFESPPIAFEVK